MRALLLLLATAVAHAAPPVGVFGDARHTLLLRAKGDAVHGLLYVEGRRHVVAGKQAGDAIAATLDGDKPLRVTPVEGGVQIAVDRDPPLTLKRKPLPDLRGTWAGGSTCLRVARDGETWRIAGATGVTLSGYRLEGTIGEQAFHLAWTPAGVRYRSGKTDVRVREMTVEGFRFLRFETFECRNDTEGIKRFRVAIYRCERYAKALKLADHRTAIDAEFVRLPPDGEATKTTLGSPRSEKGREPDEPVREVEITPFLIARTETTQRVWKALGGPATKHSFPGPKNPATMVTWYHAADWCKRQKLGLPHGFEFEYANRGGTRTHFFTGVRIDLTRANINLTTPYHPDDVVKTGKMKCVAVGSYPPNAYGLLDTTGNAWEWCADIYPGTPFRIRRGGGFTTQPRGARSSNRSAAAPFGGGNSLTFRAVRPLGR